MALPLEPRDGVHIDQATLRRVGDYPACFLTFTPTGSFDPASLIPRVEQASAAVDADLDGNLVTVTAIVEGGEGLHIRLHYEDAQRRQVRQWASQFADALTGAGLSGVLGRQVPQHAPAWASSGLVENRAVTALYATRAATDAGLDRRLATAHGVNRFPHHLLSGGSEFSFAVPYTTELVTSVPEIGGVVRLQGWDDQPSDQASITISKFNAAGWTRIGDRAAQTVRAKAALAELAPDVDQAFAEVMTGLGWWGATQHHPPHGLSAELLIQRRGLLPHRVIDAHGLQILTAHHLEQANSLTDWQTRQIGDRYLVEARDLDPWFANDEPDPEVLDGARVDFGAMIITRAEFDALLVAEHEAKVRAYQERVARGETT